MTFKISQPVKLIHKFFLAFFITNITLVGLMFVFIYMTFSSGFNRFVEQEENKQLARVKAQLIELYIEQGSWQLITQNTQVWRSIVDPIKQPRDSKVDEQPHILLSTQNNEKIAPSFFGINLPAETLKTGQRISLYDKNKSVIIGRDHINENPLTDPIMLNNHIIGWIGLVPSRLVQSSPAKAFLAAQFHNYFMISLLIIVIAFIMAIVLSLHLIKPIKQIVAGTDELAKGHFSSRITPYSEDELGILAHNFNKLAHTLEQNQQIRYQWVSDTSHELKTPLTVLNSHLLAVQEGVFIADPKRIDLLLEQVNTLNHIVDDLAQLAQADTAHLTYNNAHIDIISIIKQSLDSYTPRFKEQKLTVNSKRLNVAGKCIINGDKKRLLQLFTNLFENTCRYTHQSGQIALLLNQTHKHITLILQDSAPGVSPNELHRLFERFYRVEKSRNRNYGGSGLGLAICKQIVEAHGGKISLHTSPLGGLEVNVTLPLLG
jgi:two-component system sensor histidine kinase BaeS